MFVLTDGKIPLVGAGGVHDGASALMKIRAGASLVQLYSALVYKGPGLVTDILNHLAAEAAHHGGSLANLRGRDAAALAHQGSSGR
jgi:dihydroorotate dehydrogenase